MELIEVTPEKESWITQKVLYAYETHKIATLFVESDENLNPIYGYRFLDGNIEELPDADHIESWEDAEKVFLEIVCDLLGDEGNYYINLKNMCKELTKETEIKRRNRMTGKGIKCSECEYCRSYMPRGNTRRNFFCEHPDIEYITKYYKEHKIRKMERFIGFGKAFSEEVPVKGSPAWCPKKAELEE